MKDLEVANLSAEEKIKDAHKYLLMFLEKAAHAKRGGIHDFIEITLSQMVEQAIGRIDAYLSVGHKEVSANEIMQITVKGFQDVLDNVKRNMESMREVTLQ